jgi:tetratricopeptide (TPR) repeat protein
MKEKAYRDPLLQGIGCIDKGEYDAGVTILEKYLVEKPDCFEAIFALGRAFAFKHDIEKGCYWLDKALIIKPVHRGVLLYRGQLEKYIASFESSRHYFESILAINPKDGAALNELGCLAYKNENLEEAERLFNEAIRGNPPSVEAYGHLAVFLIHKGDFVKAELFLGHVLSAKPDDPITLRRLALVLKETERKTEALNMYQYLEKKIENHSFILEHNDLADFYSELGSAFMDNECDSEAYVSYHRALAVSPDHAGTLLSLGLYFFVHQDYETMEKYFSKALVLYPNKTEVCQVYANVLRDIGRASEGLPYHRKALDQNPDNKKNLYMQSLTELDLGLLKEGWEHYEARHVYVKDMGHNKHLSCPQWCGENKLGSSLMLCREQGVGDEIMFSCMLPDLAKHFSYIVYACDPKLKTLFARSFPNIIFVPYNHDTPHVLAQQNFNFQSCVGSLPRILRPTIDTFPDQRWFLLSDPMRTAHWKERFLKSGRELKVGLTWRSTIQNLSPNYYYPPIESFAPILSLKGVHFVNLQCQATEEEIQQIENLSARSLINPKNIDYFNDMDAAACVISACDVVIGPGTATIALSAALGIPTISVEALHSNLFHLGQEQSPWFQSMMSVKKGINRDWSAVMEDISDIISRLAKNKVDLTCTIQE